jgi:ribonucleotide reductase alpha subunit/intein/homing endonuclease
MSGNTMYVVKRNGTKEKIMFDKVQQRLNKVSKGLDVNTTLIAQRVLSRIYNGVKTSELDELGAQLAIGLSTTHYDYGTLAARIAVTNHQKNTEASMLTVVQALANQIHPKTHEPISYVSAELLATVEANHELIDTRMQHDRDLLFDYFGFKTLERAYLLKDASGKILERPQHLWMRVALALWPDSLERAFETYDLLSTKCLTHATPTLFNAGTPNQQLSSCFLIAMKDDSIKGIFDTLEDCALISKHAGGIGLHCSNIRAKGSVIKGTNGTSNGLMPMLRVFNSTARYVDQCFTPDTIIYTKLGPKPIEDVSITDYVLTSDNTYEHVKLPVRHEYNGKLLDIRIKHSMYSTRVTPEHQIFALRNQTKGLNYDVITNRLNKGLASLEFCDAGELQKDDFLVFPIPNYVEDVEHLSEDDCRFYGILLGDGHISGSGAGVSLNNVTKTDTITFVENYLTSRGIKLNIYNESSPSYHIKWSSVNPGFKFTKSQLYDSDGVKHVDASFLHLPINKIKQLIRGLIETDGCIGSTEISFEVTSYSILEAMRYWLLRLGALTSGYERNRVGNVSSYKNITTRLPTGVLRIPRIPEIMEMFPHAPASQWFTFLKWGNYLLSRIETIVETNYEGIVHDFEIAGPHDYTVAHLGIAHNGGGRRAGSFAIYLEPWHADLEDFLRLKLPTGSEEERARDLFYALWIPDLFMERVEHDGDWTLFCPAEAPGLADVWGDEFNALYEKYEAEGRGRKTVKAQDIWHQILQAQIETGTPYLVYKDAANRKSNQQNLGTIKSSNLCVAPETLIYTDKGNYTIKSLAGQKVNVWNGDKWSETTVMQTGTQQKLITVKVRDAIVGNEYCYSTIHCTPYHKFILHNNERINAQQLTVGTQLYTWRDAAGIIHTPIVISVNDEGRIDDTYCFNEPTNHAGVFNGVLTGNCSEIIEYSSPEETAVCNLASIGLPSFVHYTRGSGIGKFDYEKLRQVVKVAIRNLDRVIDINFYPTPETRRSNMRHRPVGLGVQGLADVLAMMRQPWESAEAADTNQRIFEHIYYAAVETSAEIAQELGSYETFHGSPAQQGKLQPDLWNVKPLTEADGSLNWPALRAKAATGLRNSLLVAPMPTASTSQILGYNECFEPFTSNIYTRRTLAGEFIVINKYLMRDLQKMLCWTDNVKQQIIAQNGSIQGIDEIPANIQALYKTSWEIRQRTLIDMAAARGAFICQSQSLNLFLSDPTFAKLTSMHFHGWKKGLKTGVYYLRTRAPIMAQKFTVDPELQAMVIAAKAQKDKEELEGCTTCSA